MFGRSNGYMSKCYRSIISSRANVPKRSNPRPSLPPSLPPSLSSLPSYAFNRVASSIRTEAEYFDPYTILDLPPKANSTVIKSQYRRLSLKHHPDKNPSDRKAAHEKFNQVAKAYRVRTARYNGGSTFWQRYLCLTTRAMIRY